MVLDVQPAPSQPAGTESFSEESRLRDDEESGAGFPAGPKVELGHKGQACREAEPIPARPGWFVGGTPHNPRPFVPKRRDSESALSDVLILDPSDSPGSLESLRTGPAESLPK